MKFEDIGQAIEVIGIMFIESIRLFVELIHDLIFNFDVLFPKVKPPVKPKAKKPIPEEEEEFKIVNNILTRHNFCGGYFLNDQVHSCPLEQE